jgi:Flp pilus assembly protein TadD
VARSRRATSRKDPATSAGVTTAVDVGSLFAEALKCHQAGRLLEAVTLYRRILAVEPQHANVHCNLGAALADLGQPATAEAAQRRAIELKPDFAEAHNNLGNLLKNLGRPGEAETAYRAAIAHKSDFAGAYSNLGTALADLGRREEAEAAYRQAIALLPRYAGGYNNLGNLLKDLGRLEDAEAALRHAIALMPDYPEAHSNLGNVLRDQGRFNEAEAALRHAIKLRPHYPEAHSNLANTLLSLDRPGEAEAAYRHAISLKRDYPEAHSNLGFVLKELGRLDEAEAAFRHAVALRPNYPEAHSNLGTVLMDLGRPAEAEVAFHRAIALKPDCAGAYNNLGLVLKDAGRLTEARRAAEQAVGLAPRNPSYFGNLGEVRRYVVDDPYVAALETLANDKASLRIDDKIHLAFALAKAYADIGREQDGFRQLLAGNALKRSRIAYDEAAMLDGMARVQAVFTSEFIRGAQGAGDLSPVAIFVIGMPRSGTTLVEQILASHPQVSGGGELKLFERATADIHATLQDSPLFPEMALRMSGEHFHALGARYVAELKRVAPAAPRVTDKMPTNFLFAGLIHLALPNAIIIHTLRDPLDTCVSCFSRLFSEGQKHSYDLAELGRYYRHYQSLMAHWHRVLPPGRILDVRYEDVVDDLEGASRRIVAHCGLPWDTRCLEFHSTERPVRTASATQVRQPIYRSSVGRWRTYDEFLGPLVAELALGA